MEDKTYDKQEEERVDLIIENYDFNTIINRQIKLETKVNEENEKFTEI